MSDTITEDMPRTERDMEQELMNLIENTDEEIFEDVRASSFDDSGLLTRNKGVIVRFPNGSEFQITIVQSAYSERKCAVKGCHIEPEDEWTTCEVHYEIGEGIEED